MQSEDTEEGDGDDDGEEEDDDEDDDEVANRRRKRNGGQRKRVDAEILMINRRTNKAELQVRQVHVGWLQQ